MTHELDKRDLRILHELEIMAHDVPPVTGIRLTAAVAIRGEVMAWGTNEEHIHV